MVLSKVDEIQQSQYVERYPQIASSTNKMDEISIQISLKLLQSNFDKSVLNQPKSLLQQILQQY